MFLQRQVVGARPFFWGGGWEATFQKEKSLVLDMMQLASFGWHLANVYSTLFFNVFHSSVVVEQRHVGIFFYDDPIQLEHVLQTDGQQALNYNLLQDSQFLTNLDIF